MLCYQGQLGKFQYNIVGNEVLVNHDKMGDVLEQKGDVFATKMGSIVTILDFKNKRLTQKFSAVKQVYDCR